MSGKLFIISAPSGAGKTTLVQATLNILVPKYAICRVVTYTTKTPRIGEKNGQDYHFLTPEQFKQRIKRDFFLEWSSAYNAHYGSPRHILNDIKKGQSYILILDREGARQIIRRVNNPILIWIYTANMQVLRSRLTGRATEKKSVIDFRMAQAQKEMAQERVQKLYHHHVLNDDFDQAVHEMQTIICSELDAVV